MNFDGWISGYKVRVMPWVDGKTIYVNVQYFQSGQSISQPPVWDKTVYLTDDKKGRNMVQNFLDTIVNYIAEKIWITNDHKVVITVQ